MLQRLSGVWLFNEPNPMPVNHCLWRHGLIRSPECRLPLTQVSPALGRQLDRTVPGLVEVEV